MPERGEKVATQKDLEYYLAQFRRIAEHREKGAMRKIWTEYKELLNDLKHFLADYYAEYAIDDELTFEILNGKRQYARFLEEVSEHVRHYMPRIAKETISVVDDTYRIAYDGMVDAVEKSVTTEDLKENLKGVKAATPSQVRAGVLNDLIGITPEMTYTKDTAQFIYDLQRTLNTGLINGDRYSTMAKRVAERCDISYRRSQLIVRTETHRVREKGFLDSGIEINQVLEKGSTPQRITKRWKSMHDEKVRHTKRANHREVDGVTVGIDEEFTLLNGVKAMSPGSSGTAYNDCNCRCILVYELKDITAKEKASQALQDIREPIDIDFDTTIEGVQPVDATVLNENEEIKTVTVSKRNTTEWQNLPKGTKDELRYSIEENKPFYLQKGEYTVQRYVEGTYDVIERDEIAKELGAKYLGFNYQIKKGKPYFIDFYKKGDEILYSVGKADINKNITQASLKSLENKVIGREKLIIDTIGNTNTKKLLSRNGDDWVNSMKQFHKTIKADGKPTILSDSDYNALNSPTLYRGIAPQSALRRDITTNMSTKAMADEFFIGESPFPSRGVYGDGVAYCSPAYKKIAVNYATNGGQQPHGGVIIEFKLKDDARIINYEDALDIFRQLSEQGNSKLLFNPNQHNAYNKEVGKAMNSLGYDAIIKHNGDNSGEDFYVILNRSALATKQNYIKKKF